MLKPSHYPERRSHRRVFLELPLDYQTIGSSQAYGGIAIDGSEAGLFIHIGRNIPVGTQLKVSVLFADEFELTNFTAVAKIVRKIGLNQGRKGYGYGLQLLRIDEEDLRKFSRFLMNHRYELAGESNGPPLVVNSGVFSKTHGWLPRKGRKSFFRFLSDLLKIR
jgi:hypothetical protein